MKFNSISASCKDCWLPYGYCSHTGEIDPVTKMYLPVPITVTCTSSKSNKNLNFPPFSEDKVCIKCRYADIATVYHKDGSCWRISSCERGDLVKYEHIVRTCKHCHYYWYEAPLDSVDSEDCVD